MSDRDFIAVAPCGHVRAWMAEEFATARDRNSFYADGAKKGYAIERCSTDDARIRFGRCAVCDPAGTPSPQVVLL